MKMILHAHGYDSPGIGAAITRVLFEKDCCIENFKMLLFEGFFTMMISFSCKDYLDKSEMQELVKEAVKPFEVDIRITTDSLPPSCVKRQEEDWIPYRVSVVCADQTSVLYYFMQAMAKNKINVASLRCKKHGADNDSGFQILAKIEIPITIAMDVVKASLEELGRNLNAQIDFNPINSLEL